MEKNSWTKGLAKAGGQRNAEHEALIHEILINYGASPFIRLFKQNTGKGMMNGRWVNYGTKGMTDLHGFCSDGIAVFIEIKTGAAKLSKVQQNFRRVATDFGCRYLECRSLKDFEDFHEKLSTTVPQFIHKIPAGA